MHDDAVFRASNLAHADAQWVDTAVVEVLEGMFGGRWVTELAAPLPAPWVSVCVDVSGLASDSIHVRVARSQCAELSGRLGLPQGADPLDLVSELANVIAGHVKRTLADGMSTGLPVEDASTPERPGYRGVFVSENITVEVTSGG